MTLASEKETFVDSPVDIGQHVDEMHEKPVLSTSDVDANDQGVMDNEADPIESNVLDSGVDEPPAVIAGAPPANNRTPRPRHRVRRPRRFDD